MLKITILLALVTCSSCTWMQNNPAEVKEIESAVEEVAGDAFGLPGKLGVELVEDVVNELDKPSEK